MTQQDVIQTILNDSKYNLAIFSTDEIDTLRKEVFFKETRGGSITLHWRPDQVKKAVIPILSNEKQLEIQQKVTKSFNLRKQSKHLLACAKRAVEIAIEKDEETAINWLEEQIKGLD